MAEHGKFCWNELATRDFETAAHFYEEVLGWTAHPREDAEGAYPYVNFTKDGECVAGMIQINASEFDGVPNHWFSYIQVDDTDAAVTKAEAAGGKVLRPPFDIPNVGRIAIITDPTGAALGLVHPTNG